MTYESLRSVFVYTGIASILMAAIAVALFFWLKIPDAFAYLTGSARKKGIELIRRGDDESKKTAKAPKKEKKTAAKRPRKQTSAPIRRTESAKSSTAEGMGSCETEQTTLLDRGSEETTLLGTNENLTTVLSAHAEETTLLAQTDGTAELTVAAQPFVIEFEITYLNADVLIK